MLVLAVVGLTFAATLRRRPLRPPSFEAALAFGGHRPGRVFKRGPHGLGYYVDAPPPRDVLRKKV